MQMYHSWGSHNAWQRQLLSRNCLYIHRETAAGLGIADESWVWVIGALGRVKARARLMDGVEPGTVWTWNAVGKRSGTWSLAKDGPESREGFLLNHLIPDVLPGAGRLSNSDPLTGQAAWYDLKVRLEPATDGEAS